jgi:hypothetical protein
MKDQEALKEHSCPGVISHHWNVSVGCTFFISTDGISLLSKEVVPQLRSLEMFRMAFSTGLAILSQVKKLKIKACFRPNGDMGAKDRAKGP